MDARKRKGWVSTSTSKKDSGIPALDSPEFSQCRCSYCNSVHKDTSHWTNLHKPTLQSQIKIGNRVRVNGEHSGVVKYIGDLNSSYTNGQVYIGVKLDDPVGEHDGTFKGKRYFSCAAGHGIIVPIEEVHLQGKPLIKTTLSNKKSLGKSGLQSMTSKSWAQNRISSHSVAGNSNGNGLSSISNPETSTSPRAVENEREGIEGVYSNEGDMIVEDAEDEEEKDDNSTTHEEKPSNTVTVEKYSHAKSGSIQQPSSSGSPDVSTRTTCTSPAADTRGTSPTLSTTDIDSETIPQPAEKEVPLLDIESKPKAEGSSCSGDNPQICAKSPVEACESGSQEKEICGVTYPPNGVLSPPLPPPPPVTVASNSPDQASVNEHHSLTSCLFSGLPHKEVVFPPKARFQVGDMASLDGVLGRWGGDLRAWSMAGTYQRLKDALRRGEYEIRWQRKIRELEMNSQYTTLGRHFKSLRADIRLNNLATSKVEEDIAILRQKQWSRYAKMVSLRAKLEREQEKTRLLYDKMMSYPSDREMIRELQTKAQNMMQGLNINI